MGGGGVASPTVSTVVIVSHSEFRVWLFIFSCFEDGTTINCRSASFCTVSQAVASSAVVGRIGTESLSGGTEGSQVGHGARGQSGESGWAMYAFI